MCFREDFKEFGLREGGDGVSNGVTAVRRGSEARGVLGGRDGVEVPLDRALWGVRWWQVKVDVWDKLLALRVLVGAVVQHAVHAVGGPELWGGRAR